VLRGVGGESAFVDRYRRESQRVRQSGVQVARSQSLLDAAQVLVPGTFVVLVTWLAARFAVQGRISVGDLVAFYGYAAFLVTPLRTITEAADKVTRALVAAQRMIALLTLQPSLPEPAHPLPEPPPLVPLQDGESGLLVKPGLLTAVVSPEPVDASALADRLGRYVDAEVRLGGVLLSDLPLEVVRRRVQVVDKDALLLSGVLREELGGEGDVDVAVHAACAADVLEALPDGLDTVLEERGRQLSGGQRQRLVLARALLADPEVLVLDEPTSAVDAHTEARIAERLRDVRAGRTTVVMTSSPLVLDRADEVVLLLDGRVVAVGTHRDLLDGDAYRSVVLRTEPRHERPPSPTRGRSARTPSAWPGGTRASSGLSLALYAAPRWPGWSRPRLLGALVEAVERGTTAGYVDRIALLLAGAVLLQTALTKWSRTISLVLAEEVFADLREDFLERVVALPLSTVERAGSGDLLSRTTSDIDTLAKTVRYAVPEVLVATVTSVLTIGAAFLVSPRCQRHAAVRAGPVLLDPLVPAPRPGRLPAERAAYAVVTAGIAETAEGARTVESLRRQEARRRSSDDDIRYAYGTELYTLRLRTIWFPLVDLSFVLPLVSVVAARGLPLHPRPGLPRRGDGGGAVRAAAARPARPAAQLARRAAGRRVLARPADRCGGGARRPLPSGAAPAGRGPHGRRRPLLLPRRPRRAARPRPRGAAG
jgi:ABC-type multidrug transport system fused ATPase/permease subunit